jgi:hypothetical protein
MIGTHSRRRSRPDNTVTFWRVWVPCFLLFGLVMCTWAVATPLGAAPDEGTTIAHAVAAVRGQLIGTPLPKPSKPTIQQGAPAYKVFVAVRIPKSLTSISECFAFKPTVSAACQAAHPMTASRADRTVYISVGHYPPLYYLLVGLPSYLPGVTIPLHFMTFATAAMCAALLATAVFAVRRWARSRTILLGVVVAVSPMVLFLSGVINPSSLEVAAAVCLWTTATIWAVDYSVGPPKGLLWTVTASAAVLIQARPASLAWPVMVAIVLLPLVLRRVPLRQALPRLARTLNRRDFWPMYATLGASSAFAVAWIFTEHSFLIGAVNVPPRSTSEIDLIRTSFDLMPSYFQQSVGVFGWLDTGLPTQLYDFWYWAILVLLGAGLIICRWRGRLAILLVMMLSFLVPTVGTLIDVHSHGFSSQGRYFLPIFVGMPIVAAGTIGGAGLERRIGRHRALGWLIFWAGIAAAAAAQVVAFGVALRRYLVGIDGPILPWAHAPNKWTPPLPGVALDVLALVGIGALYWFVGHSGVRTVEGETPPSAPVADQSLLEESPPSR